MGGARSCGWTSGDAAAEEVVGGGTGVDTVGIGGGGSHKTTWTSGAGAVVRVSINQHAPFSRDALPGGQNTNGTAMLPCNNSDSASAIGQDGSGFANHRECLSPAIVVANIRFKSAVLLVRYQY